MPIDLTHLLTNYVAAMHEGDAALFIGAGISRPAGFVDWKGLLRVCAKELNLDIDREHDLVAVAQYYLNRRSRDRSLLNQILKDEFDKPVVSTKNHEIIARLPIYTIWTTNFDKLIEEALRGARRSVDVKSRDKDIATHRKGRDVVLYKMHGDIARPDEAVICKDDYERYARNHPIFQNALEGDLLSKTFLFLGFSFSDPNLDYMLGHLRSLLEDSKREHYAVMRRTRLNWHKNKREAKREFEYEMNKQALQLEDLQRYSIQTLLIDDYSEVTDVLETLEEHYYQRNVFVSGSAHEFGEFGETRMRDLCVQLGERLIEANYKLVSGFGLNIGSSVVEGALLKLYERGESAIEKHLFLRPFPRHLPTKLSEAAFNRKYREDMIAKCGFAVFVAGTSRTHPESEGVLQEYEIVKALGKVPIPIGATGFAARRIWEMTEPDLERHYLGVVKPRTFRQLNDPNLSNEQILDVVFDIIKRVSEVAAPTHRLRPSPR
ncbi:MAG TPA: SIR2 family protein [Thermoanaerobaculia bacterium]|jgi:hypothetical protein